MIRGLYCNLPELLCYQITISNPHPASLRRGTKHPRVRVQGRIKVALLPVEVQSVLGKSN